MKLPSCLIPLLFLCLAGTVAAQQEPAPDAAAPRESTDPTPAVEAPEDEIENVLQRSADHDKENQRAKAGGALLEVAEIV